MLVAVRAASWTTRPDAVRVADFAACPNATAVGAARAGRRADLAGLPECDRGCRRHAL